MSTQLKEREKVEQKAPAKLARALPRKFFSPRIDIYESKDKFVLLADMPGVDELAINITLEKNVLAIEAAVAYELPEGYSLIYSEYPIGDYRARFVLADEIDSNAIEATVRNGILTLILPKSARAQTKKIAVKAANK